MLQICRDFALHVFRNNDTMIPIYQIVLILHYLVCMDTLYSVSREPYKCTENIAHFVYSLDQ